jgi:hypothetical protein
MFILSSVDISKIRRSIKILKVYRTENSLNIRMSKPRFISDKNENKL